MHLPPIGTTSAGIEMSQMLLSRPGLSVLAAGGNRLKFQNGRARGDTVPFRLPSSSSRINTISSTSSTRCHLNNVLFPLKIQIRGVIIFRFQNLKFGGMDAS
jgi:hypothetical protein